MNLKEIMLNALQGAIESVGESKLEELFDQLHEKDAQTHRAALIAGAEFCRKLAPLADKTKTPIDNAILNGIAGAIADNAEKYNIEL